jgi:uncharacterized protein
VFVGRTAELHALERAYEGQGSALVPIYGRRRVGKSELILRFLTGKPGLYYLGKTAPALLQMQELLREAARVLDEPLLASLAVTGWKDVLLAISERWRGPGKLVLVLDEFQWIAGSSPELPSVLQECWDRHWKKSGNIVLILCGSFVGFMEREVLGKQSPLFGRRTAQILLQPFSYREAAAFHPSWSTLDRARAYFICGGIPLYLRFFDTGRSIEQNIESNLLDEFAPLFREPDFLLREELREVDNYYAVLRAIASGSTVNRDIAAQTGIPERSLHYYIQQLIEIGYVAKRHPLTGARPTKHHVRYVLEDPILRFWFFFVFENLSYIQQMGAHRALRDRIRPRLDSYYGACFERLCRQALPRLYEREGVSAAFQIGEYWSKETQIDVIGLRDDGWTDLGECKWGKVRSLPKLRDELEAKVIHYPNRRNATIGRRYFLQTLPATKPPPAPNARWHDLDDLYA